jgi:hypothetical protein
MGAGEGILMVIVAIVLLFLMAFVGAFVGAVCGWLIGFTPLGTYILNFLSAASIHTNMVDLGAFVGFTGGFFSSTTKSSDK